MKKTRFSSPLTIALCCSSLFISNLSTAAVVCSGTITRLAISPGGTVQVNYGHGVHYVCSLEQAYSGFNPETCKVLYATMLSA